MGMLFLSLITQLKTVVTKMFTCKSQVLDHCKSLCSIRKLKKKNSYIREFNRYFLSRPLPFHRGLFFLLSVNGYMPRAHELRGSPKLKMANLIQAFLEILRNRCFFFCSSSMYLQHYPFIDLGVFLLDPSAVLCHNVKLLIQRSYEFPSFRKMFDLAKGMRSTYSTPIIDKVCRMFLF